MHEMLPSFERDSRKDKKTYAESFYSVQNTDPFTGKRLVEPYGEHLYRGAESACKAIIVRWKWMMSTGLPYTRTWHPSYDKDGGDPGIFRSKIQSDQQPGMLWRLQFLCPDLPSGTDHTGQKSGVSGGRSHRN